MLGVVVCCDGDEGDAVIWCEDHAELAFLRGPRPPRETASWPRVGDLVQFRIAERSGLRYAQEVRVLAQRVRPDLAETLAVSSPARLPRLRRVG